MTRGQPLYPLILGTLIVGGCNSDQVIDEFNDAPVADLSGNVDTVTKGATVTFTGKISDEDNPSTDLTASWTVKDKNGPRSRSRPVRPLRSLEEGLFFGARPPTGRA